MNRSKQTNRWKNLVGVLLAPVLAFGFLRWFEQRTVYHPSSRLDATGDELGFARESLTLATTDNVKLNAWYFQPKGGRPDHVFLICHGNGGNISHRLTLYDVLLREGAAVLAFDYRGYGRSEGKPGEEGTYRDAEAAFDWLVARGWQGDQIIALGESLGGGVASALALRRPVGGLVLQSTFTSTADLGAEMFPWLPVRLVGRIKYDTHSKLPRIHVPVLVLHSREDSLIPFHHGQRNFEAANKPKLFHELHGDHNDTLETDRDAFVSGVHEYLTLLNGRGKEVARGSGTTPNPTNADEQKKP